MGDAGEDDEHQRQNQDKSRVFDEARAAGCRSIRDRNRDRHRVVRKQRRCRAPKRPDDRLSYRTRHAIPLEAGRRASGRATSS
jgi:hypothetical protein